MKLDRKNFYYKINKDGIPVTNPHLIEDILDEQFEKSKFAQNKSLIKS